MSKKKFKEFEEYIKNKRVAVVGVGVSNIPLISFLVGMGAKVTAFDKKTELELGDIVKQLEAKSVNFVLGEDYLDKLSNFEVIFKTPSMRIDSKELLIAKSEGSYITSEMEEFIRYCPAKIYGVTGSDGKTTTTTIIYNLLKEQGYKTWVGGNIGTPLFSDIKKIKPEDRVVIELSSFQLMTMDVCPEVSIVTNLTPNHLDIHKGMEEYIESKKNIFLNQDRQGMLILNRENNITYEMKDEAKGKVEFFSSKRPLSDGAYYKDGVLYLKDEAICEEKNMAVRGIHNVENYMASFLAVEHEVSKENMSKVFSSFKGVPHRNEFVREVKGVRYYNDSIGSSPTRTLATISVFEKPVILIAGGYDKAIPFEPLANEGYNNIKSIILFGNTKEKIKGVFEELKRSKEIDIPIYEVDSLEEAVIKAQSISSYKDNVVLSPACASFDMFKNFEVRGNKFKELVNNLK
ncbi:UDP-N-acetylmuramoyl-L-alanine--D-glutamate ligase [Clostridium algidicarnis]|uniref:UDP-N-acetylmuramoyl-L-alanine--D-glutamate ligase n=1 Tax=Clostridium algidicarnis TaxID=37659 RepID=UPI001C0AF005|nr:UDP-N-acetylmuramoyl-L-alanine--D-glutamate ligase [Clostridium algidicarnis]MBU3229198.1 UDP-N-acetylmuramoyl-L-alanine--D-glutamate ligase [Clostridium algidicarnis]MBU3252712.1 UDP-N-acetylmuramoyl-L-alanine--D-glutamate ligase [Clostridium algidicarnis]